MDHIRILICDDSDRRRAGTRAWLSVQPDFDVVADLTRTRDVLDATKEHSVDVVLIEIEAVSAGLLGVIRQIQDEAIDMVVLLLSAELSTGHLASIEEAGAMGVLPNSLSADELAAAVRRANAGEILWTREQWRKITDWRKALGTSLGMLTDREWSIWAAMLEGRRNQNIAECFGLSTNTIKNRATRLFDKLGVGSRAELFRLTIDNDLETEVTGRGTHKESATLRRE
jgi:two-component system response regulator DesR